MLLPLIQRMKGEVERKLIVLVPQRTQRGEPESAMENDRSAGLRRVGYFSGHSGPVDNEPGHNTRRKIIDLGEKLDMRWLAAMSLGTATALMVTTFDALGADKSQYSLFNPTPERLLRDMTTDRPDTTESPFTVD
jgi:hypothetical protein